MAEPRRSAATDRGDLDGVRMLVVEARFYDDIADALLAGATRALEEVGADFERVSVPGSLEVPPAIASALGGFDRDGQPLADRQRHPHRRQRCPGLDARPCRGGRQRRGCGARRACLGAAQAPPRRALKIVARSPTSKNGRKANRRGAARLAAVQALYQMDIAGTGVNDILAQFESHWIGREVEGNQYLPAEAAFFREVVNG